MEQIYYKEINLDDEGNFTMDITKDTLLTKKLWAGQEYVVSGLSIKPLRNNDVTKWDDFAKIVALSEKINNAKPIKNGLFDLTMVVLMKGSPKESFEEKLKLLNQPETKIYKYFNTKKMKKYQITFEDYEALLLNEKLKFASANFDLSIYPNKDKEDGFFKKLTTKKIFEYISVVKDYNFFES